MADETGTATAEPDAGSQEPVEPDWKSESRKHESRAKAERKAREAAEAKLAEHAEANQTETEKLIEKARKEATEATKAEVSGAFKTRILNAEIRAQAAGKFANKALAVKLLDLDASELVDEEGEPDEKAIARAVDDFLKQDENAGLRAGASSRPAGDADAGKGKGAQGGSMEDFIRAGIGRK